MPRLADHDLRRREIARAVWRLAVRGGLEQVTLRQVATEAEVSPRLLQYYFGTRDQLLLGALEILNAEAEQRAVDRVTALGTAASARETLRGVLLELLPLDDERRERFLVHAAYFVRFLTEPALAAVARDAAPALDHLIAALLIQGRERGEVPDRVDVEAEAAFLVAGAEGLQASVLLGQRTPESATILLDRQLDRLFPSSG